MPARNHKAFDAAFARLCANPNNAEFAYYANDMLAQVDLDREPTAITAIVRLTTSLIARGQEFEASIERYVRARSGPRL